MSDRSSDQDQSHGEGITGDVLPPVLSASRAQGSRSRDQVRNVSSQRETSSGSRQFLFIDANTDRGASSEAVRVHVMREAHRNRRERSGTQDQSQDRRGTVQDEMVIFDSSSTTRRQSPAVPDTTVVRERSDASITPPTTEWQSIVQTGVRDSTLRSLTQLHRLAEGYLRSVRLVRPDVLQLCEGDFLSLNAYLALAAFQLASSDQESANVASVQFEARALGLLRARIAQPSRMHADSTIVAVLLLSRLEELKNNNESALFHQNALRRLVHDRGGLQGIQRRIPALYDMLISGGFVEETQA